MCVASPFCNAFNVFLSCFFFVCVFFFFFFFVFLALVLLLLFLLSILSPPPPPPPPFPHSHALKMKTCNTKLLTFLVLTGLYRTNDTRAAHIDLRGLHATIPKPVVVWRCWVSKVCGAVKAFSGLLLTVFTAVVYLKYTVRCAALLG